MTIGTCKVRFGSVCSGIEAASVAWNPLGWHATWLSEIEPFPSAVLAHHYPDTPNLGDMTKIAKAVMIGQVEAPEVLTGGTPCQAFSVAGLRESLADERGNLTLKFVELADAIDHVRGLRGERPSIIIWENVPGVLSTKDNAFGCFLAGLAGEDEPLQPPGQDPEKPIRWSNAGCVYGPQRAVAWRTLDAQYFGVAQRRRRVFVVASARNDFDPAAVLFEWDGVRRDTAPRREAGESVARGIEIGPSGGGFTDLNPTLDTRAKDGPIRNQLAGAVLHPATAACLTRGTGQRYDPETETETETILPHVTQPYTLAIRGRGDTHNLEYRQDGTANALLTPNGGRGGIGVGAIAVPAGIPEGGVKYAHYSHDYAHDRITDPAGVNPALTKEAHASGNLKVAVPVAFPANLSGTQCATAENIAPSMGAKNPTAVAVGVTIHGTDPTVQKVASYDETAQCLRARTPGNIDNSSTTVVQHAMQVRRLTPVECEKLQGFPPEYTAIPWRKKPASECPDGPRYKALGNSWAVPVARWVGRRVHDAIFASGGVK
jgi:DNA (cytosine-5)-methyltransferase 1